MSSYRPTNSSTSRRQFVTRCGAAAFGLVTGAAGKRPSKRHERLRDLVVLVAAEYPRPRHKIGERLRRLVKDDGLCAEKAVEDAIDLAINDGLLEFESFPRVSAWNDALLLRGGNEPDERQHWIRRYRPTAQATVHAERSRQDLMRVVPANCKGWASDHVQRLRRPYSWFRALVEDSTLEFEGARGWQLSAFRALVAKRGAADRLASVVCESDPALLSPAVCRFLASYGANPSDWLHADSRIDAHLESHTSPERVRDLASRIDLGHFSRPDDSGALWIPFREVLLDDTASERLRRYHYKCSDVPEPTEKRRGSFVFPVSRDLMHMSAGQYHVAPPLQSLFARRLCLLLRTARERNALWDYATLAQAVQETGRVPELRDAIARLTSRARADECIRESGLDRPLTDDMRDALNASDT